MSRNRRLVAVTTMALGLTGFTLAASGCTITSPKTIETPYAAADGTNSTLPLADGSSVQLRNFLLVSSAKDSAGVLVGAVTTDSASPVEVALQVLDPSGQQVLGQATVTATAGQLTEIGPSGTTGLQLADVPQPPGGLLTVHAVSGSGGSTFSLPVLAPEFEYSTITPTATPSPTPSAKATASAKGKTSAKAVASPTTNS